MKKILVLLSLICFPAIAQADWIKLGEQAVDHRAERDTFRCGHQGPLTGIYFKVLRNDVRFFRFLVTYANGQTQEVPVNAIVPAGQSSRYIDLPGRARVISRIDLWYKTLNHRGPKAHLLIFGREFVAPAPVVQPPPPVVQPPPPVVQPMPVVAMPAPVGWVHLGTRAVDHRAERDTFPCAHQGPLAGMHFRAMHNDVRILRFLVTYANGVTQSMPVNAVVPAGRSSRYIDLPGVARIVTRVDIWYKTLNHRGPKAHVALFGRPFVAPAPVVQPPPPVVQPPPPVHHATQWIHLGTQAVDHRAERDTLRCSHQGALKGLQFRVTHNDVRFLRFQVVYANGQRQEMPVAAVVRAGESSPYYDLPGRARVVRSINFWYKTLNHRGPKAHVAVYARQ